MTKQTPLMRQYTQIKQKYPETILLFRLGDFFETFEDDAKITAKVCGITLTKRNNGAAGDMPLAGFPHHQLDAYLPKLVRAGYRVAVCEQLEDPKNARGIVKRGVVEVVTPGVAIYDKLLDEKSNNFLASLYMEQTKSGFQYGFAAADISTGEFITSYCTDALLANIILNIKPKEIIISKTNKDELISKIRAIDENITITKLEPWIFEESFANEILLRHFKTKTFKGFGIEEYPLSIIASGAVLNYINETQSGKTVHITNLRYTDFSDFMTLDLPTLRNLELASSFNYNENQTTFLSIIDKTLTAPGGRLLKKWVVRPLKKINNINFRLSCVNYFFNNKNTLKDLQNILKELSDLERLAAKIATQRANPNDLIALKKSLLLIPDLKLLLDNSEHTELKSIAKRLIEINELVDLIDNAIVDEPSNQIGSGLIFNKSYNSELYEYISAKNDGKQWVSEFQENERKNSNIPSLKVGFNNVFGYYIEVTKVHSSKVPEYFERRQTLTNAERYTTPELKKIESKILGAEENINNLERVLFTELLNQFQPYIENLQNNANTIAAIDCLQSYASVAIANNYVMPEVNEEYGLLIEDGRHPVVEKLLPTGANYTPNSTLLSEDEMLHIITGPNMSGKSCYLRQNALIVLMAQIGSFVPAKKAIVGLVDRIFTRVGAQDNITGGESTFLIEMQEAANIMNNATERSLILLDEVGRGTATFDGISIAWAIAEFIHNIIGAKTLFATHYHELNELAERFENIINYQVEVIESGKDILFTHKVQRGASNHSFGIYVAKMAGLPNAVIERAETILHNLENTRSSEKDENVERIKTTKKQKKQDIFEGQLSIFEFKDDALREKLKAIELNAITPLDAFKLLADIKKELE